MIDSRLPGVIHTGNNLRDMEDLDRFPRGAVLVATHDSSLFVKIMPFVSAIITETGTPTSHMAALCRELKIPTIVNAGSAVRMLNHGQEITVTAEDDGTGSIYAGIVPDIVARSQRNSMNMEEVYEYRKRRYILRYISPLNSTGWAESGSRVLDFSAHCSATLNCFV